MSWNELSDKHKAVLYTYAEENISVSPALIRILGGSADAAVIMTLLLKQSKATNIRGWFSYTLTKLAEDSGLRKPTIKAMNRRFITSQLLQVDSAKKSQHRNLKLHLDTIADLLIEEARHFKVTEREMDVNSAIEVFEDLDENEKETFLKSIFCTERYRAFIQDSNITNTEDNKSSTSNNNIRATIVPHQDDELFDYKVVKDNETSSQQSSIVNKEAAKSPKKKRERNLVFDAIVEASAIYLEIAPSGTGSRIGRTESRIRSLYTSKSDEDINKLIIGFGVWWTSKTSSGRPFDPPSPETILKHWGSYVSFCKQHLNGQPPKKGDL